MNLGNFEFIDECSNCSSRELTWYSGLQNTSGVVEGRLRTCEINPIFYLGCDECSETLKVVNGDESASLLNSFQGK